MEEEALQLSPRSTTSSSSTRSAVLSQLNFASLPVVSMKRRIVEKIMENRVTLIVGETGCGKSSQVPQFLLEEKMEPIICTQPRRFAVVAIAKMVAKARNCELGEEVGYHIGHSKLLSQRTKIVFKTAGVLLEEMRDKGLNALKYKVIILDEVHERSVESDLVLVCVKQFLMKNNDLRVVLMSATADITRYRDYFKDLGRDERVEVLAIPNSNQQALFQRRVSYLEEVSELLGIDSEELSARYCSGPSPSLADADIIPEVHKLIHDLIMRIHENEPDIEKGILVFLPTYRDLVQQWNHLRTHCSVFKIHILHRSIDTEQALLAMKICKLHRKVILATNIAESSVTIPKVAYVIDSCRSLQVFWDANRKMDSAELVWVSKSQAEQRRGRTGRTCDGQVYRLVTRSFYGKLDDYERPSILRLSLRQQVLLLCCAESRSINDPKVLLQKALDPPDPKVVNDALSLLFQLKALNRTSDRGRYEPTFYGQLLASFSLSFDASVLILKFGDVGLLREGIVLGILMDIQPLPILHPFGDEYLFTEYISHYFDGHNNSSIQIGRKEMVLMGNVSAYQFWQRVFKDKHRIEHLKQLLTSEVTRATTVVLPKIEEEWCVLHNLVQPSLHNIAEIYEDILSTLHCLRPNFLGTSDGIPMCYMPYEFKHTCVVTCEPYGSTDSIAAEDEQDESSSEIRKCSTTPYVDSSHSEIIDVAKNFSDIIKEIKLQYSNEVPANGSFDNGDAPICIYFTKGTCNRGVYCPFSHSLTAKKPPCKFFLSLQGCRNGESCYFSHVLGSSTPLPTSPPCVPEERNADNESFLCLFPTSSIHDDCILVVDDTYLHFTSNIASQYDPSKIISTTSLSGTSMQDPPLKGVKILWGLHHPYQTILSKSVYDPVPWHQVMWVLWFLNVDRHEESLELQKIRIKNFFSYLAIRILADSLYNVRVMLTMNNIRFSQLQVEKLARESFFYLSRSFPFDEENFGKFSDTEVVVRNPMVPSKPIAYLFNLHPPTDLQFGNYASTFKWCLRNHLK